MTAAAVSGSWVPEPTGGASTVPDAVLLARAYLSRVAEPASLAVWDLVERIGPLAAAEAIRTSDKDVGASVLRATDARRTRCDPEADLAAAERADCTLLVPESADWPHYAFAPLQATAVRRRAAWRNGDTASRPGGEPVPPVALWIRGAGPIDAYAVRSVAIVGARAASAYGEHVSAEFGYGLAGADVVVVSGGAFGIDAAAHRGALAAGGHSVLVSAGGLDRAYPAAHSKLFDEVAESGLLISESPPGSAPQRHRFLSRNRLIAAIGAVTVVVEAGRRSGSLNTAAHARALGRPVLAVPGPITSAMSVGCHDLITRDDDPARLAGSFEDVLATVPGSAMTDNGPVVPIGADPGDDRETRDALDPLAAQVLDGLPARGAVTEDDLAVLSGVAVRDVMVVLPLLRLAGLVASGPDGHRLLRAGR